LRCWIANSICFGEKKRSKLTDFYGSLSFLNELYAEKESITPDHKKHKPVPVIDIYKVLPGTNCKECGFSACMAFAAALSKEEMSYDKCPGLKTPEKEQLLTKIGVCLK
jgi:ArsR family metal-binding transcriptional regulator